MTQGRQRRTLVWVCLGGLAGAAAGSLPWAVLEASSLHASSDWVSALALTSFAACLATVTVAPLAIVAGWAWHGDFVGERVRRRFEENAESAFSTTIAVAVGAIGFAIGMLALTRSIATLLTADGTRAIATSVGALAIGGSVLVASVGVRHWLSKRIADAGKPAPSLRSALIVVVLLVGGWVTTVILASPNVVRELELAARWPVAVTLLGAIVGSIAIGSKPKVLIGVGPLALLIVVFGGLHLARVSGAMALRQHAPITHLLTDWRGALPGLDTGPAHGSADASATCWPDRPAKPESAVGRIRANAPDIILVTVDALRWDRTNLAQQKRPTTPNLAKYAKQAAVFHGYTPASSTRQTFRALFTGLFPSLVQPPKTRKWAMSLPDGQPTLAGFLRAGGFETIALLSKTRLFPKNAGALQGFEGIDASPAKVHAKQGYSSAFKVDRIIAALSDPERDGRPRFIWTHLFEPHQPYAAGPAPVKFGRREPDRYDSAVRFVDGELGRLLAFARGPTRKNRTAVIITADHGQAFKEHGNVLHGATAYEEEVHVPLVFLGPEIRAQEHPTRISLLDVVPTVLEYVGLQPPTSLCGRSLVATLRSGIPPEAQPVYIEQIPDDSRGYFAVAFIENDLKLVLMPNTQARQVFDLKRDPGEKDDLGRNDPELLRGRLGALAEFYRHRGMDPASYSLR